MARVKGNPAVERTRTPGIAEMNALAAEMRRSGQRLFNFGQAVPFFPPPAEAVAGLTGILGEPEVHRYSPDPGLPALREAWSRVASERFGLRFDPDSEILITAGANGAYLTAMMALLAPGDRMALPTPCYFNHEMALTMIGAEPVEIRLDADRGFGFDPGEMVGRVRAAGCRALTLVNPNNPTGVTYPPEVIRELAERCLEHDIVLVMDETYAFYPGSRHEFVSPGSLETSPSGIITIGSFSKTFALTGWRVGYVVAAADLIAQMLKVQDTMVICAPHASQRLVLACLEGTLDSWLPGRRRELQDREQLFLTRASQLMPWRVCSSGPFFAWLEGPVPGRLAAERLLRERQVIVIPGEVFGREHRQALRVSLGGVPEGDLLEGMERLGEGLRGLSEPGGTSDP